MSDLRYCACSSTVPASLGLCASPALRRRLRRSRRARGRSRKRGGHRGARRPSGRSSSRPSTRRRRRPRASAGIVILELMIDDRAARSSRRDVVRSVPPFDEAALAAVRQWEYEITQRGRQAGAGAADGAHHVRAEAARSVTREPGIPELRQGAPPPVPASQAPDERRRVTADVHARPGRARSREAGDHAAASPPWSEALLQALRTWRFAPPAERGPGRRFEVRGRRSSRRPRSGPRVRAASCSALRRSAAPPAGRGGRRSPRAAPAPRAGTDSDPLRRRRRARTDPAPPAAPHPRIRGALDPPPPAAAAAAPPRRASARDAGHASPARRRPPPAAASHAAPAAPPATAAGRRRRRSTSRSSRELAPPAPHRRRRLEPGVSAVRDVVLAPGRAGPRQGPAAGGAAAGAHERGRRARWRSASRSTPRARRPAARSAGPSCSRTRRARRSRSWMFRRTSAERLLLVGDVRLRRRDGARRTSRSTRR